MHKISHREHASLAHDLIEACGGLEEAARACRVQKSSLSGYQNANDPSTMPADVIDALQLYARRGPIYTARLHANCQPAPVTGCLKELACDLAQESIDVLAAIRIAMADDVLSPNDLDAITAAERDAENALERLRATRRAIEAATPAPQRAA